MHCLIKVRQLTFLAMLNELSLVREKQAKILAQYLGKDVAESLAQGEFTFAQKGERSEVSIVFVDLRGFTSYSENNLPKKFLKH